MSGVSQALYGGIEAGTAILLPALGELIGERSGVVNLGTEGAMLAGALSAFAVASSSGNPWLGVVAGIIAGAVCGAAHAWMVVRRRADQLASGLVVWFLAVGVTSVFGTGYIGRAASPLPVWKIPGLAQIPGIGHIFFDHDALVYVGYLLVLVVWFMLHRTRLGLVLRATGERPAVVAAAGGHPDLVKALAVMTGSALAGVGGAQLSVGYVDNWFNNMTNGYGFVAVAVVLFAAWRPVRVLFGAYLFGIALATASVLQAHGVSVNQYVLDSLPYVITLVALVIVARGGNSKAPEGLTKALTSASS